MGYFILGLAVVLVAGSILNYILFNNDQNNTDSN